MTAPVIIAIQGVRGAPDRAWECGVRYADGRDSSRALPGATDRASALAARDALAVALGVPVTTADRARIRRRRPARRACPVCGSLYRPTTTAEGQRVERMCLACWRGDTPARGPSTNYLRAADVDAAVARLERAGFLPRVKYTNDGVRFEREEGAE